jgi:hypothetical protein
MKHILIMRRIQMEDKQNQEYTKLKSEGGKS